MRFVAAITIFLLTVVGLGGVKYLQIAKLMAFGKAMAEAGPPPEVVGTAPAKKGLWEGTLAAVGTVTAARGVAVSNEAAGVVKAIRFESGQDVRAGQVLVELDSAVERAQLASTEARLALSTASAARTRRLHGSGAATSADLDRSEADEKAVTAELAALRAQIERKTVRAPFAGRLGIRQVNLGQYLAPGTPVTVLESLGSVYVDFWLPQQRLSLVPANTSVRITLPSGDRAAWTGRIAAIEPTIDEVTRNVKVRAALGKDADRLRAGMFVNVEVVLPDRAPVIAVPSTAIVRATYGNSLFVVENRKTPAGEVVKGPDGQPAKVARQQLVKLGDTRGDYVAVESGLEADEEVVTAGAFKLRNGAAVVVNNGVKVAPSLTPTPENR